MIIAIGFRTKSSAATAFRVWAVFIILIYENRGQKVMLNFDLARIYGYGTSAFNQQIKRNLDRFPQDFSFQLTKQEFGPILLSHFVTSSWGGRRNLPRIYRTGIYMLMTVLRCRNFTSRDNRFFSGQKGGTRKPSFAFTEQGIYTLMPVLLGDLTVRQSKTVHRWAVFNQRK